MQENNELVEVCLYIGNTWLKSIDIEPLGENDTFEEPASWLPIKAIHSKQRFEALQKQGYSYTIPNTTVVLAKIKLDDLIECTSTFCSGSKVSKSKKPVDFNIQFEIENGKFKTLEQVHPSSKPKMK
ncbi:TPA: hypothetical protein QDB51_003442 [Burkholderia vietnamiensis]|nr:hypothetical protein [Burkholderia vietnamiensis]